MIFETVGWLGNVCFFSRWVVQWLASERAKTSAAPRSFFLLSLAGSVLLFSYTLSRGELILLAGFVTNSLFYWRNLALLKHPGRDSAPRVLGALLVLAAILAAGAASGWNQASNDLWLICGLVGQTAMGSRFAVQWWLSERRGVSHFPAAFWWVSLCGSLLMLAYASHTGNPIWIVGHATAWLVPIRNLVLASRGAPAPAVRTQAER